MIENTKLTMAFVTSASLLRLPQGGASVSKLSTYVDTLLPPATRRRWNTGASEAFDALIDVALRDRLCVRVAEEDPRPDTRVRLLAEDAADAQLADILASCPELQAVAGHVRDFADLMNKHRGDRLPDWMLRVQADNLPACAP
jgi:hypothetical protein